MDREIYERIRHAGVVGAGGAGFPTHVKVDCEVEYVIANGAECEPLLRVDQQLAAVYAKELIEGLRAMMRCTGAKEGVILLKGHYHEAIDALQKLTRNIKDIRLHLIETSFYPAGDELQVIYEVTGRVVPTGGLPKDVGCVVSNVATMINVARAMQGKPVITKEITVGGAVLTPCTLTVPIGTPMQDLIEYAGGTTEKECVYLLGGPCMGSIVNKLDSITVTKTSGGLFALPKDHPLLEKKSAEINIKVMQSVCCQCSMCTQMCPRNALGLNVQPHKAMRTIANGGNLLGEVNGIFSCCDCGICTYVACNFGLKPNQIMKRVKGVLAAQGVKPVKEQKYPADRFALSKRVPTERMIARMGLEQYNVPAPLYSVQIKPEYVRIPLKMHSGAPATPVVAAGDRVTAGVLIADVAENALGAKIHASINGTVTAVTQQYIEITADKNGDNA